MTATTIKTDSTLYRHRRTDGLYRARHIGLAKCGPREQPWIESVFYQSADRPSQWFCRDLESFAQGFVEEREHQITVALSSLSLPSLERGYMANWFRGTDNGRPVIFGDLVDSEDDERTIQVDAKTETVQYVDEVHRFAITSHRVYILLGDEVAIAG
jgi:hypothetical protein